MKFQFDEATNQFSEVFICQTHSSEKGVILLLKWIYKKEGRPQLEILRMPLT